MKSFLTSLSLILSSLILFTACTISCTGMDTYRILESEKVGYLGGVVALYGQSSTAPIFVDENGYILPGIGILAGTAFAIDKDHLLTAGHICMIATVAQIQGKYTSELLLRTADKYGHQNRSLFASIIRWDLEPDLCLLLSEDHGMKPLPLASSRNVLRFGDEVYVLGAPNGSFPVGRKAEIAALSAEKFLGPDPEDLIAIAGLIQGGNSGSPVIAEGKVVGLVSSISLRIDHIFFAVPVDLINEFMYLE